MSSPFSVAFQRPSAVVTPYLAWAMMLENGIGDFILGRYLTCSWEVTINAFRIVLGRRNHAQHGGPVSELREKFKSSRVVHEFSFQSK